MIRVPRALRPGDRIGVTSPSSGIGEAFGPRLDVAVRTLTDRGFVVEVGSAWQLTAMSPRRSTAGPTS